MRQRKLWQSKDSIFIHFTDIASIVNPKREMKGSAITDLVAQKCTDLWPQMAGKLEISIKDLRQYWSGDIKSKHSNRDSNSTISLYRMPILNNYQLVSRPTSFYSSCALPFWLCSILTRVVICLRAYFIFVFLQACLLMGSSNRSYLQRVVPILASQYTSIHGVCKLPYLLVSIFVYLLTCVLDYSWDFLLIGLRACWLAWSPDCLISCLSDFLHTHLLVCIFECFFTYLH